jgi:hypothetical protein
MVTVRRMATGSINTNEYITIQCQVSPTENPEVIVVLCICSLLCLSGSLYVLEGHFGSVLWL